ncbi:unnamed protein product [Closterium sp. NIES-65]|nr:unnamed protein product [Closterium sp. NIES-65]
MTLKDQPSVESPRVPLASSSRVSWSLFLLLVTIPLLFLLHILVLRYSCIAPAWTVAIESDSQDELKPVGGVAAMIDVIGPLSDLRGSMGDSETDLGVMEEADAPRKMEEAEPAPRWMEEAELSRRKEEAEPPRGMVDAERSADRLQYPGRKRVVGLVGVFTDFSSRERRSLLRDTWFPATPEEHARVETMTRLVPPVYHLAQEERTGGAHRRSVPAQGERGGKKRALTAALSSPLHPPPSPPPWRVSQPAQGGSSDKVAGGVWVRPRQERAQGERGGKRRALSAPLSFPPPFHLAVSPRTGNRNGAGVSVHDRKWVERGGRGAVKRCALSAPFPPSPPSPSSPFPPLPVLPLSPSPRSSPFHSHSRVEAEAGRVFRFIIGNECSAEDEERCPALPILPPSSPLPPHYTHFSLEAEAGLVFRFIIGHGTSAEEEEQLQVENSTHGDLLRIDVDEADFNANRKALVYFTSLFKLYEAEFYVKADDDIYLIPDRLASLVAMPRKSPRTYLGCFKNGAVVTNPDMSEFEPNSRLLGPQYFLHAYSNIYSLSYGVVKILNSVPNGR